MVEIQVNSQGKAYIANGKALEAQRSAPVITSLNVTPTTSAQTITAPSGVDGYSPINVAAVTADIDSDIKASNIKSGVSILGVTGTVTELNGETRTETLTSSAGNTFTPSSGKNAITSITVTPNNQNRSVTPSTSAQTLNVNSGYSGNGTISVSAVTSSIDANIQAGNIKKDVQILGVTGTYEGSSGKYKLLDRVKDDSNREIGTVIGFFADENNVSYAVVCTDAKYRQAATQWLSVTETITDLPVWTVDEDVLSNKNRYNYRQTATFNTQKILDYCAAKGYTSTSCSHCRSKSFVINGTRYYGQLPNTTEIMFIAMLYSIINSLDTTASSYKSTNFSTARAIWSSVQCGPSVAISFSPTGLLTNNTKTNSARIACPVLEIPNAV